MPLQSSAVSRALGRSDVVLMVMAAGGRGTRFEPMRVQNLLFLVQQEMESEVGGPHFRFRPGPHGPFDPAVYDRLESLEQEGQVGIAERSVPRTYSLTGRGLNRGAATVAGLPNDARRFLTVLARWVLARSPGELVTAVAERYPEMVVGRPFADLPGRAPGSWWRLGGPSWWGGMARAFDMSGRLIGPPPGSNAVRDDAEALRSDWRAVGDDLRAAMADFATANPDG